MTSDRKRLVREAIKFCFVMRHIEHVVVGSRETKWKQRNESPIMVMKFIWK